MEGMHDEITQIMGNGPREYFCFVFVCIRRFQDDFSLNVRVYTIYSFADTHPEPLPPGEVPKRINN